MYFVAFGMLLFYGFFERNKIKILLRSKRECGIIGIAKVCSGDSGGCGLFERLLRWSFRVFWRVGRFSGLAAAERLLLLQSF